MKYVEEFLKTSGQAQRLLESDSGYDHCIRWLVSQRLQARKPSL
jgi:hypothetical protein